LATLKKIYSGRNDNFGHKLGIFYDLCLKANITPEAYKAAYYTILQGPALDHYHTNLRHYTHTARFEDLCGMTKKYFESPEYQRGLINRWNLITLGTIMGKSENVNKPISEYLQLLLTEMRHLKLGLPPPFCTDETFHAKLIQACQAVPASTYICCKPVADISGLIEELESSIATHKIQEKMANTTLFTDRRYYRQTPSYSTNRSYNKQTPFRQPPYPETLPRATTYWKPPGYTPGRKCYICQSLGCWSSNHSREEQDNFWRRQRSREENRPQRPQQYITDDDIPEEAYEADPDKGYPEDIPQTLVIDAEGPPLEFPIPE
jgi:hypothetical protein